MGLSYDFALRYSADVMSAAPRSFARRMAAVHLGKRLIVSLAIVAAALGGYVYFSGFDAGAWVFMVPLLANVLWWPYQYRKTLRRIRSFMQKANEQALTCHISDGGIELRQGDNQQSLSWPFFHYLWEYQTYSLLASRLSYVLVLPIAELPTGVLELVRSKVIAPSAAA